MPPQRGAAVIGGDAGRQNQADAAVRFHEPQCTLEKQLVQVGVPAAL
jgi:hypothetical protein